MSFNLNDNQCVCSHPKANHILDKMFTPRWCELNQKACDCWQYKTREVENREIFDLQIVRDYK